ncbi:MAG TPA: hypothetical protein VIR56_14380 [Solimonas sp.]
MNTYHIIEILIVGGAVGFSVWNLAKRFVPQLRGRSAATRSSGGCSSCDSCGACSTPPPSAAKAEQPVHFHHS